MDSIKVETIKNYIKNRLFKFGPMTFVELTRNYPGNLRGSKRVEIAGYNLVLWDGVPDEFNEALFALRDEGFAKFVPCDKIIYVLDGATVEGIELAKTMPDGGYKEPRWLPVLITMRR